MDPYQTCEKLSGLIENYIVEGTKLASVEIQGYYLKNLFPSMFSKTFLDFILDMRVTDRGPYDQ